MKVGIINGVKPGLVAVILCFAILCSQNTKAELPDYSYRLYYFYELGNRIPLSDFELGSDETIKDQDGNGLGFSWVIKKSDRLKAELDFGYSHTAYKGRVEDGVTIEFEPQEGSGYEILSSSTNVVYDFDVDFDNPYIGISFVTFFNLRIGGGRIFQSSTGNVTLYAQDIRIVEARYEPSGQLYAHMGFDLNLDWLYVGAYIRGFEASELKITYCNEEALGSLACSRIEGATGNRNLRSNAFGEALLHIGILF